MAFNFALAKRGKAERDKENWLEYYAGYSRSFVDSALDALSISADGTVLDPWSGSGTTGLIAGQRAESATLVEINPIIAYMAAGNIARNSLSQDELQDAVARTAKSINSLKSKSIPGPALLESLRANGFSPIKSTTEVGEIHPATGLAMALVLSSYRAALPYQTTKNPTWNKINTSELTSANYRDAFKTEVESVLKRGKTVSLTRAPKQIIGDARNLPIADCQIQSVLTSPPYLTRIDYVRPTSGEILWLFGPEQLRAAREVNMGAPVIRKDHETSRLDFPDQPLAMETLEAIRRHQSYAAASYYFKNILQYLSDAHRSLREIFRVLKPNSTAILVVQNSYFKDIEIPLGEIYIDLWTSEFGGAEIIDRQPNKNTILQVNSRAQSSKHWRDLHEDVVALYKPGANYAQST